jgi:hypothetical protein
MILELKPLPSQPEEDCKLQIGRVELTSRMSSMLIAF